MLGRLLMIGLEGSEWDNESAQLLKDVQPGAVIFFNRNTKGAFRDLVARVRDALDGDVLLAADVEGGTVDRLRDLLARFPSVAEVAAARDDALTERFGALIGEAMSAFGLNLNLAPVLDLAGPVMGTRAAGSKAEDVIRFARCFMKGMSVIACGKHFPGLGAGAVDTHSEMAVINKDMEEDLAPFRALAGELPMIMMSHASYPTLGPAGIPATLSPAIIGELLREKIGFRGLVVSDDLEMGGVLGSRTIGEAAVAAVDAGCQLLPICHRPDRIREAHNALRKRADADSAFAARAAAADAFVKAHPPAAPPQTDLADLKRRIQSLMEDA